MEERSLLEKIALFIFSLSLPLLILCVVLCMYSNYKCYQFIKYHKDIYVYHQYCFKLYNNFYACSDTYALSED